MAAFKHSVFSFATFVLLQLGAYAIGPPDIGEVNADNKAIWDKLILMTGIVDGVEAGENTWVEVRLKPENLLSGSFDPGVHSNIRIAYRESVISGYAKLNAGDQIVVACFRKSTISGSDSTTRLPEGVDFGVVWAKLTVGKSGFLGLAKIGELDRRNGDINRETVKLLQAKIREIRAFKK